jgi:hypothetical protein
MDKNKIYQRQYELAILKLNESKRNLIERPEDEEEEKAQQGASSSGGIINAIQTGADVVSGILSFIPGANLIGSGIDAVSAAVDTAQGEYGDAALRAGSAVVGLIPGGGAAVKGGAAAVKAAKAVDTASDVAKAGKAIGTATDVAKAGEVGAAAGKSVVGTTKAIDTATGAAKEAEILGTVTSPTKTIGPTPGGAIERTLAGSGGSLGVGISKPSSQVGTATRVQSPISTPINTGTGLATRTQTPINTGTGLANRNAPNLQKFEPPDARRIARTADSPAPESLARRLTRAALRTATNFTNIENSETEKEREQPTPDLTVNKYKVGQFELDKPTSYSKSIVRDLTPDTPIEREMDRRRRAMVEPQPQLESSFPIAMQYDWDEDEREQNKKKVKEKEIEVMRIKPGVFELPEPLRGRHPYLSAFDREDSGERSRRTQRGISQYFKRPTLDIAQDYARSVGHNIPESTDIMSNKDYHLYSKVKSSVSKYLKSKEGRELDTHLKTIQRDLT